jgi:hypothetical protein
MKKIPDPESGSAAKKSAFLAQNTVSNLPELWSGMFIPDPDFLSPSRIRILGSKKHRIRNTALDTGEVLNKYRYISTNLISTVHTWHRKKSNSMLLERR